MRKALTRTLTGLLAAAALALAAPACDDDSGGCKDDYDCPNAKVCVPSTGTCTAPECKWDEDCQGGDVCRDHVCQPPQ